jgi:hypothetical protein
MNTKGYKTSKDYEHLKELLDDGFDVICFSDCDGCRDVCHAYKDEDWYRVTSRGIEYNVYWPDMHRYSSFEEMCKDSNIEFIEPVEEVKQSEQPEYSYLEEFHPIYHCGKKPTWKVGDKLAYYELTTDAEGECIYGIVDEVHFDEEHEDWRYQLKDYPHWMDDGVIYEEELISSEAYKVK